METKHISKFEDMNMDIAVNVLYFERESKEYKSPHLGRKHQVNLLLLDEPNTSKRHHIRITNMSRLVAQRTKCARARMHLVPLSIPYPCRIHSVPKLLSTIKAPYCSRYVPPQIQYPNEGDATLQFHSCDKQHKVPFLLVSDFETFTPPTQDDQECNTKIVNNQQVSGFCVYRVTENTQYQTPPSYTVTRTP